MLVVANDGRDIVCGELAEEVGGHGHGVAIDKQRIDVFYRQLGAFVTLNDQTSLLQAQMSPVFYSYDSPPHSL